MKNYAIVLNAFVFELFFVRDLEDRSFETLEEVREHLSTVTDDSDNYDIVSLDNFFYHLNEGDYNTANQWFTYVSIQP